jgi:V/A-type H+-transporting ATPase subunit E
MNNKLQELTDKLYSEGLAKGQQEAGEMVNKAKNEAEELVALAKQEADTIINEAKKQAAEISANAYAEIKLAGKQAIAEIRQKTETAIVSKVIDKGITPALSDKSFVQSLIRIAAEKFNLNEDGFELSLSLPEDLQKEFAAYTEKQIAAELSKGMEIKLDKNVKAGFKIGLKDGGYYIGFTDEDFNKLFSEYLRPKVRQLLFGE